ncbi:MAG: DUF58 domain-containing protein [Methylovulum sp.]|jgi:uncharacterized protein (DUF58 family)|nr:DUF58 domain-containing protein [Methylovulum sp.]MCF7997988.1 DUF58 domain-containing protein [Methylovulum sp.]
MRAELKARFKSHRLFAGEPAADAPVILTHRRIFILPTLRGLSFVVVLILLWLIAFVYNNNLAYLLTFLLGSVFFITILHTVKSLSGLSVQKGRVHPVFAGEAAGFMLHLNNLSNYERPQLSVTLDSTEMLSLPAAGKAMLSLYSSTHKRGWHHAGKITIASCYPLGLFRAWSPIRFDFKVLVYPKPAMQESPFPDTSPMAASYGINHKGSADFYGLQTYQPGDSIKHIHWKAFAKGLGVYSKHYGDGSATELWLDFQQTQGASVEQRLSQLCRWVLDAERANLRYGLVLPGLSLAPDNGAAHSIQCLEALALF